MPEHDELDQLLDSALSSYAEPEPGLDGRVLQSLFPDRGIVDARRRLASLRRWLPWAIGVPLAAALAFFFLSTSRSPAPTADHAQSAPQSHAQTTKPVPFESSDARQPAPTPHHLRRQPRPAPNVAKPRALPKQQVFPSLQPLSPEEQALVAVATHAPKPELQSLIASQSQDAPVTISAIHIQPLNMPDPGHD